MVSKKAVDGQNAPKAPSNLARDDLFHKLKNSLFQEAFELCLLTGAHVCIIVFSPHGKPYSFGYPSVDMVANKFLNLCPPFNSNPDPDWESVSILIQRYYDLLECMDAKEMQNEKWPQEVEELWEEELYSLLEAPYNQLNSDQLVDYKKMLEKFWDKVEKRIEELEVRISEGLIDFNAANPLEAEISGS